MVVQQNKEVEVHEELSITIGFSTTNKWISRLIRWITRAPVSHAWIAFYDHCLDTRLVMQAESWGYEVRPWHRWLRQNIKVAEFRIPNKELVNPLREVAKRLGTDYDFRSAFWVGVRYWIKKWISSRYTLRLSRTPTKLMCSESVIRFLSLAGVKMVKGLDPEITSPGELLSAVKESDEFEVVERKAPHTS